MRKLNKEKIIMLAKRVFVSIVVIVMIVCLPSIKFLSENTQMIYETFIGKKSDFQGAIEIWNVDTFESGSDSKINFLNRVAKSFQNENKGVFVVVRNMTESECLNQLKVGLVPDLLSCSYGVANEVKDYIKPYNESFSGLIRKDFEDAGKLDGSLYGLAWCRGSYFLISTKEKLQKAKIENLDSVKLVDIALNSGYETKHKNSVKVTYSLGMGSGKFGMPQMILKTYNITGESSKEKFSIDNSSVGQSGFLAYSKFIAGQSVILLGTQRDVVRVQGKVDSQKIADAIFEPLTKFTDLVQFMFLGNVKDSKNGTSENFAKFLTSQKAQRELGKINMFPVIPAFEEDYNLSVMQHIIPEINGDCDVLNVFLQKDKVDELQKN